MRPPAKNMVNTVSTFSGFIPGTYSLLTAYAIVEVTNTLSAVPTTVLLADIHKLVTKD